MPIRSRCAGRELPFQVGAVMRSWDRENTSCKADEYQNKLRHYEPWSVILTSLDWDHLDFSRICNHMPKHFVRFFGVFRPRIPDFCGDSASVADVVSVSRAQKRSYGFLPENDIRIVDYEPLLEGSFHQQFHLLRARSWNVSSPSCRKAHNAQNAAAVAALLLASSLMWTIFVGVWNISSGRRGALNEWGISGRTGV